MVRSLCCDRALHQWLLVGAAMSLVHKSRELATPRVLWSFVQELLLWVLVQALAHLFRQKTAYRYLILPDDLIHRLWTWPLESIPSDFLLLIGLVEHPALINLDDSGGFLEPSLLPLRDWGRCDNLAGAAEGTEHATLSRFEKIISFVVLITQAGELLSLVTGRRYCEHLCPRIVERLDVVKVLVLILVRLVQLMNPAISGVMHW